MTSTDRGHRELGPGRGHTSKLGVRPRRKRWLVGAAAGTVLAIASLVAWLGLRGEPEVSAAQPSPEPAPLPAVRNSVPRAPVPHAAAAAAAVEVSRPEPVTEALQALSEAEARLRHIRMRRAYPLWTQPLDPANVWTEPEPFRGSSSEAAPGGRIFVRPERAWVDLGSPIRFFVTAVDEAGSPAAISGLQGETSARWYGHTPHPRLALSFNDDGANGDEKAGDLVYTGVLELAPERGNAGDWTVSVDGTIGGDRRGASSTVLVVPGDARFTGEFREEIVDGNLVVHAGVEVMRQTFTHVRMELFAGDRPVAQAWASGNSEPGKRMFDVKFYGKVIRDQGIDGPYTVRHAVLSTGGEDGRFPGKAVDPVLETAPYRVTAFTDHNRNEGNALLDEQERLALEDIEAAKGGFGATDPSQQGPRMTRIDKNDTPIPE